MKITFLGTGTSQGVPVIGCNCEVCSSKDPRDKRLRSSVLVSKNNKNILIDIGPEGGEAGGYIVAQGTPEDVVHCSKSITGHYLKKVLKS